MKRKTERKIAWETSRQIFTKKEEEAGYFATTERRVSMKSMMHATVMTKSIWFHPSCRYRAGPSHSVCQSSRWLSL
jgi:hypothetical protein